jgi:two-component system phosphate regulon response regulator PhoB
MVPPKDLEPPTPKILIADDSRFQLVLLTRALEARGFQVLTVEDGMQANRLALRAQPNAIILDLSMPGSSRLEVLKRLKRSQKTEFIPVLVLTANSDAAARESAISLGAQEYLNKPADLDELTRILLNMVKAGSSEKVEPKPQESASRGTNAPKEIAPGSPPKAARRWGQILHEVANEITNK